MSAIINKIQTQIPRLSGFGRWWVQALSGCLPDSLRHVFQAQRQDELVIAPDKDGVSVHRASGADWDTIGRFDRSGDDSGLPAAAEMARNSGAQSDAATVLRVPSDRILSHELKLPIAAEENLAQVLGFEMDRRTPFTVDQVYYNFRVSERSPKAGQLRVQLVAAPRQWVDEWTQRLEANGLSPERVEAVAQDAVVTLREMKTKGDDGRILHRMNWVLGATALILAAAVVLVPLVQMRSAAIDSIAKVDAARRKAQAVASLRERVESVSEATHFLANKRRSTPRVVEVLNALTRTLPDGTWVQQFNMNGQTIEIRGESSDATSLIQLLETSERFENSGFRSPVTRNQRTGKERFHLSAKVIPESS